MTIFMEGQSNQNGRNGVQQTIQRKSQYTLPLHEKYRITIIYSIFFDNILLFLMIIFCKYLNIVINFYIRCLKAPTFAGAFRQEFYMEIVEDGVF